MNYDWSGARHRRMKVARLGAALTVAATVVAVVVQVMGSALWSDAIAVNG